MEIQEIYFLMKDYVKKIKSINKPTEFINIVVDFNVILVDYFRNKLFILKICSKIYSLCKVIKTFSEDIFIPKSFLYCEFSKNKILITNLYNRITSKIINKYIDFIATSPDKSIEYEKDLLIIAMIRKGDLIMKFKNIRPHKKDVVPIIRRMKYLYVKFFTKEIIDIVLDDAALHILKYLEKLKKYQKYEDYLAFSSFLSVIASKSKKIKNRPEFTNCIRGFLENTDNGNRPGIDRATYNILRNLIKLGAKSTFELNILLAECYLFGSRLYRGNLYKNACIESSQF